MNSAGLVGYIAGTGQFAKSINAIKHPTQIKVTPQPKPKKQAKVAEVADDVAGSTSKTSPYRLQKTQNLTLSKKQMLNLTEDIKINGVKEPIKYVEHNGTKYIVDGHHRASVAKQLGINEVPIERVKLPYAGYKSVNDLFWIE